MPCSLCRQRCPRPPSRQPTAAASRRPQGPRPSCHAGALSTPARPQTWPGLTLTGPRVAGGSSLFSPKAGAAETTVHTHRRTEAPALWPHACAAGDGGPGWLASDTRPPTACGSDPHPEPDHRPWEGTPTRGRHPPAQQCRPTQRSPGQAPGPAGVGLRLRPLGRAPSPQTGSLGAGSGGQPLTHGVQPDRHLWPPRLPLHNLRCPELQQIKTLGTAALTRPRAAQPPAAQRDSPTPPPPGRAYQPTARLHTGEVVC